MAKKCNNGAYIPLAPNTFLLRGPSHKNGGVDISPNIEAEGGEVIQIGNGRIRILSKHKLGAGKSPANNFLRGMDFNTAFNLQENYKDRNRLNDDGSKYKTGGEEEIIDKIKHKIIATKNKLFGRVKVDVPKIENGYDFSKIIATDNRPFNADSINYIASKLNNLDNNFQRAAVIANIIDESGGDPYAASKDNTYRGLLQWADDRWSEIEKAGDVPTMDEQLAYFTKTIDNLTDGKTWTHGGKGSGYQSNKDAYNAFKKGEDIDTVMHGFTWGNVRPLGKQASYENRLKIAKQVLDVLNSKQEKALGGEDKPYTPEELHAEWVRSHANPNQDLVDRVIGNLINPIADQEYETKYTRDPNKVSHKAFDLVNEDVYYKQGADNYDKRLIDAQDLINLKNAAAKSIGTEYITDPSGVKIRNPLYSHDKKVTNKAKYAFDLYNRGVLPNIYFYNEGDDEINGIKISKDALGFMNNRKNNDIYVMRGQNDINRSLYHEYKHTMDKALSKFIYDDYALTHTGTEALNRHYKFKDQTNYYNDPAEVAARIETLRKFLTDDINKRDFTLKDIEDYLYSNSDIGQLRDGAGYTHEEIVDLLNSTYKYGGESNVDADEDINDTVNSKDRIGKRRTILKKNRQRLYNTVNTTINKEKIKDAIDLLFDKNHSNIQYNNQPKSNAVSTNDRRYEREVPYSANPIIKRPDDSRVYENINSITKSLIDILYNNENNNQVRQEQPVVNNEKKEDPIKQYAINSNPKTKNIIGDINIAKPTSLYGRTPIITFKKGLEIDDDGFYGGELPPAIITDDIIKKEKALGGMANHFIYNIGGKDRLAMIPSTGSKTEARCGGKFSSNKTKSGKHKALFGLDDIGTANLIGNGVSALANIGSGLITDAGINKLQAPTQQIVTPERALKLNTTYNIGSQLETMNNTLANMGNALKNNTASSQGYAARLNRYGSVRDQLSRQLFEDKNNRESQLINADLQNQQNVMNRNIVRSDEAANRYNEAFREFNNDRLKLKTANWASTLDKVSGDISGGIHAFIGSDQRKKQAELDNNNLLIGMLPYLDNIPGIKDDKTLQGNIVERIKKLLGTI